MRSPDSMNDPELDTRRSRLQKVEFSLLPEVDLFVKRDDLIHPVISGNKWRKLKYQVEDFQNSNAHTIETMGGAFSNHLIATACAGALFRIKTVGYVRGDELNRESNAVLKMCDSYGMDLRFISRVEFRSMRSNKHSGRDEEGIYFIEEGGRGDLAVKGCEEISDEIDIPIDHIFSGVGTGTTLAGLVKGFADRPVSVHGVAAIANGDYLLEEITELAGSNQYELHTEFHGGGFGKSTQEMFDVAKKFTSETGILLDPIYTRKTIYAMVQMRERLAGKRVVILHTGGLTGWLS